MLMISYQNVKSEKEWSLYADYLCEHCSHNNYYPDIAYSKKCKKCLGKLESSFFKVESYPIVVKNEIMKNDLSNRLDSIIAMSRLLDYEIHTRKVLRSINGKRSLYDIILTLGSETRVRDIIIYFKINEFGHLWKMSYKAYFDTDPMISEDCTQDFKSVFEDVASYL